MAKLRIKAHDGKTLVIAVPAGTDPSQYDALASAAAADYKAKTGAPAAPSPFLAAGEKPLVANNEGEQPTNADGTGAGSPMQQIEFERSGFNKHSTNPVEQRMVEKGSDVLNTAGMVTSIPGIVKGVVGLGKLGVGAIAKGLEKPMENAGKWFAERGLQFAKSTLPESATKAAQVVDDAAEYVLHPHPEVADAMRKIAKQGAGATDEVSTALTTTPKPGESLIKAGGAADDAASPVADAMTGVDELGQPIMGWTNSAKAQLEATERQIKTVGGAIERTLTELNATGKMYDPKSTIEQLAGMYQRNASGQIIPAGASSAQAQYNAAVSKAIETVKANALDSNGILQKLDWQQANAVKKALQDLAEYGMKDNDAMNIVYQTAARTVRDSIDDQAEVLLAGQGRDVTQFQTLRDAYGKLKNIQNGLNNKVLSDMSQKNVAPVVRTMTAVAGLATGQPWLTAGAIGDFVARRFGPQMMARGLTKASQSGEKLLKGGADLTAASGGMSNAARGIAHGLAMDINDGD